MDGNTVIAVPSWEGAETAQIYSRRLFIWVTFQRKGFHCYPHAPDDVSYLQDRHRHLFKFRVKISVRHEEREIEFHQFLNWLETMYDEGLLEASGKSCETLAIELCDTIVARYPQRTLEVEVSEDGECGSIVSHEPVDCHGN